MRRLSSISLSGLFVLHAGTDTEQTACATIGTGRKIMGKPGQLKDPKYNTLDKMQHTHKNPDGSTTTIHYDKNPQTGELSGFKFKDTTGTTTK